MAGYIQDAKRDDWNTPYWIIEGVRAVFNGVIHLDPCSNPTSIVKAQKNIMLPEDGLSVPWEGNIFINPPYGYKVVDPWIAKAHQAYKSEAANVIALIPATTSTQIWHKYVYGNYICFIQGRVKFIGASTGAPFSSALVYWGDNPAKFYDVFKNVGYIVGPTPDLSFSPK